MELDVSQGFVHPATAFPFQAELTLEAQDVGGETVTFDPVTLEGSYFVVDDTVRLEGRLTTMAVPPVPYAWPRRKKLSRSTLTKPFARTPMKPRTNASASRARPCRWITWR